MKAKIISCCIALLFLVASPALAQWTYEYIYDLSLVSYGVHFPTSTTGYLVGSGGEVYKSTDGGATWAQQTSPTTLTLFDVFFKSATEGWAVGDNGVVILTTDGTNWTAHPSSPLTTSDLNDISFIGNDGWIGGDAGTIFLTNDNGATWITPTTIAYADDINEISFFDPDSGYAATDSDGIMYSWDGGDNWLAATLDLGPYPYTRTDIECIVAVNSDRGYASGWGSMIGPQPTIILITTNQGQHWYSPDYTYGWNTFAYGYGISAFDDGSALIVGGGSGSAGSVIHGASGGGNWTSSKPFFGEDLRACAAVPGTNTIIAVGDEGCVARSTDGGYTWSFAFNPGTGFAGWGGVEGIGTGIYAVGAASHFYAKGAVPFGGAPDGFDCISPSNWAPTRLEEIWFVPPGTIYVCGTSAVLYKSTDLGKTWTMPQHTPNAIDAFYGMYWFDPNNGCLVGEFGSNDDAIYLTSDGGVNLNLVWHNVLGKQLNSVHFAPENPLIGAVVGDDVTALYTTDGGANWTVGTSDWPTTTNDFEKVYFVSASLGWCVGDAGAILKTTDGGQNWLTQPSPTTVQLLDVYFRNPTYGWISGENQEVYYTDDGGTTWNDVSPTLLAATDEVKAVYFNAASGYLWIGAREGQLLYRNDTATGDDPPIALPFYLEQNFPNPFNPATTIKFSIDRKDRVALNVYDVNGRRVATILNKEMEAGDYSVSFKADGLSSGVYFYVLKTSTAEQMKKMILLR